MDHTQSSTNRGHGLPGRCSQAATSLPLPEATQKAPPVLGRGEEPALASWAQGHHLERQLGWHQLLPHPTERRFLVEDQLALVGRRVRHGQ